MGGIVGPAVPRVRGDAVAWRSCVSLVVSLTTTPMMCARLLQPRRTSAAHGRALSRSASASSTGCSRGYDATPRAGCCAIRLLDAAGRARAPIGLNVYLFVDRAQGLLPAAGHRPPHRLHPGRPGHLVPGDAREAATSFVDDRACTIPAVDNVVAFTGGGGSTQHRPHVRRAQAAATSARSTRRRGHRPPARQARRSARAPRCSCRPVQDVRIGGRQSNAAVPVHAAEPTTSTS